MQLIIDYLRLFRWQNLLIIVLLQVLLRYMVIIPLLEGSAIGDMHFVMLVLAVTTAAAARYALIACVEPDRNLTSGPGGRLVYRRIKKIWALVSFWLLSALAIALAAYVTSVYQYWPLVAIVCLVPVFSWVQAVYLNKFIIANHLLLMVLAAVVPILIWLVEIHAVPDPGAIPEKCLFIAGRVVYAYAFFTALTTFLREVLKDLEDFRTDLSARYKSLPVLMGPAAARKLGIFLTFIILFGIAWAKTVIFGEDMIGLSAYLLVAVMLPFLLVLFMLLGVLGSPRYNQIQQLVKLVMVTGVLSMLVLSYYLANGVIC